MESRLYRMNVAFETAALPDPGTPTNSYDLITKGYLDASYSKKRRVTNTWSSPYSAVAGTSIAHGLLSSEDECVMYLKSNGGPVDMSANPQIAAGTRDGQTLILIFVDSTDTVYLEDGNGLSMPQGPIRSTIRTITSFTWDADQSLWRNSYWNNIGSLV